jgi:hypothetical protein
MFRVVEGFVAMCEEFVDFRRGREKRNLMAASGAAQTKTKYLHLNAH